tara:strand:+ start:5316 stop:6281 length:966 start_codon:yes stop_codon:yes gene_type:complete
MSGMNTTNSALLIRTNLWSAELKEILRDEMMAQRYVRMLDGFPDGNTFNIPSIGQAQVDNYAEDAAVTYRPLDTGNFTFTVDKYLSSATYMTKKAEQDAFYSAELMSRFVPEQERAIMSHFETTTMAAPEVGITANSQESIDGVHHRLSGGNAGKIEVADFAYARYALKKANVPDQNLIAIVDPSVEFALNSLTDLVNVSSNPKWEGIVRDGIATGMKFVSSVYGFDVYTSNFCATATDAALPDREGGGAVNFGTNNGKTNLFFSASQTVNPFVGAWRQAPEVDFEYNKDYQRNEFVTTARYGVKLYRPENMVRIITNPVV